MVLIEVSFAFWAFRSLILRVMKGPQKARTNKIEPQLTIRPMVKPEKN
jgi:hypothetical protein